MKVAILIIFIITNQVLAKSNTILKAFNNDCTSCHLKLENKVKHAPAVNDCSNCHEPHDQNGEPKADNPYRLYFDKINDVCLSCHDGIKQGKKQTNGWWKNDHPVTGHPTYGPNDPNYPRMKFTCVSCHNPHSTTMKKLFRYDYGHNTSPYKGSLCAVCHWNNEFPGNPPPTPPWTVGDDW